MSHRRVATMVVFLLAATAALAQAAPPTVDLSLKGKPGEANRYATNLDLNMEIQVSPPEGGFALTLTPRLSGKLVTVEQVRAVAPNGDLTLGLQVESFDLALDAADFHARLAVAGPDGSAPKLIKLPPLPLEVTFSKRGKPLGISGLDKLPLPPIPGPGGKPLHIGKFLGQAVAKFSQPLFPDRPVRVGESWGWELQVDPLAMTEELGLPVPPEAKAGLPRLSLPLKSTSTLVGFETLGAVECARIQTEVPWQLEAPVGPAGQGGVVLKEQGNTMVTTWFDYAAGRRVKENLRTEVEMSIGDGAATPVRVRMVLTGTSELLP